jgi:glucose-1-phosphate thymidylyltransferase
MKGIVLAGGSGTRLHPVTRSISKQLLPVYDKPMIYYPLSVLMMAGIREILIISTPHDLPLFEQLLGDGSSFGVSFQYAAQPEPNGLAQAFLIGKDFLQQDSACLVLGDNIFYGEGLAKILANSVQHIDTQGGCHLFGYQVSDPERYGVAEIDAAMNILSIEEKPEHPKSDIAVTGLYFYDNQVTALAEQLSPSPRGELEITDLNKLYIDQKRATIERLGRGMAWLDTGTHDSLLEAATFVQVLERRQGVQIACLEEIAYLNGWITIDDVTKLANDLGKSRYGEYLRRLCKDDEAT